MKRKYLKWGLLMVPILFFTIVLYFNNNIIKAEEDQVTAMANDPIFGEWSNWQKTPEISITDANGNNMIQKNVPNLIDRTYLIYNNFDNINMGGTIEVSGRRKLNINISGEADTIPVVSLEPSNLSGFSTGSPLAASNILNLGSTTLNISGSNVGPGYPSLEDVYKNTNPKDIKNVTSPNIIANSQIGANVPAYSLPLKNKGSTIISYDSNFKYRKVNPSISQYPSESSSSSSGFTLGIFYYPYIVKSVHKDVDTGKDLGHGGSVGQGGVVSQPFSLSSVAIDGYTLDHYEIRNSVTTDITRGTNSSVNVSLQNYPQGVVWYYKKVPNQNWTVNFNSNGGSSVSSQTVQNGNKVTKPGDPTRDGYSFGGWYSDSGLTQAYNFDSAVTSNKTLYAKWDERTSWSLFPVRNGGLFVSEPNLNQGQAANIPIPKNQSFNQTRGPLPEIKRDGYVFGGWYTDDNYTNLYNFDSPVTQDTSIYAKWTQDLSDFKYVIYFERNGGTFTNNYYNMVPLVEVQNNSSFNQTYKDGVPEIKKSGYILDGWYADKDLTKPYDFNSPVTADITIYAKWILPNQKWTVTFNSNGGTSVLSQTVDNGNKASKPQNPIRDGYTLTGWYSDSDLTKPYDFDAAVTSNLTLYAKWEKTNNPIVNPEDGETPIIPEDPITGNEKPQNPIKENIRIQYVSDFDFGSHKNNSAELLTPSSGDYGELSTSEKKNVVSFLSIIDDRTTVTNWSLSATSSVFSDSTGHTLPGAEIQLSQLNYQGDTSKVPQVSPGTITLSDSSEQISRSNATPTNGTWSLAFGKLTTEGQSSGANLFIPKGYAKNTTQYTAVIDWTITTGNP